MEPPGTPAQAPQPDAITPAHAASGLPPRTPRAASVNSSSTSSHLAVVPFTPTPTPPIPPAVAPGSGGMRLKASTRDRPRPSMITTAGSAATAIANLNAVTGKGGVSEPASARASHTGAAPHSVYTHALLAVTPSIAPGSAGGAIPHSATTLLPPAASHRRSASGSEIPGGSEALKLEHFSSTPAVQSVLSAITTTSSGSPQHGARSPSPSPLSARPHPPASSTSNSQAVSLLSPNSRHGAQLQLNDSIRLAYARQASRAMMKSKAASERDELRAREDAEAAKLAALAEEAGQRRDYDWRSLLSKPPEQRDEDEMLFLLDWVSSLRIEFLLGLPREILMTLCRHFALASFPSDQYVFEQGEEGTHFYVILKGCVGVHVRDDEDDEEEQTGLHGRRASNLTKKGSQEWTSEDARGSRKLKKGGSFGPGRDSVSHPSHHARDSISSNTGSDPGAKHPHGRDSVSLVSSPPLAPHKPGAPKPGFIEVMTIHTGNGFGEVALLQPTAKRSASIKTKEECEFLTIDKKTYELALKDKATQERNRRETFVRNHIFFRRLVNEKQNSLITSLKEKIYPRHSVIVRQGDEILKEGESTSQIFFVASGTVLLKQKLRPHVHAVEMIARENQKAAAAAREAYKGGNGEDSAAGGKHKKHSHGQVGTKKSGEGEEKKEDAAGGQTGVDGVLTVGSLAPPPLAVRAHHIVGNTSGSNHAHTSTTVSSDPSATAGGSSDTPPSQRTPVMPVRRSIGAASKTKPESTQLPFSSSTHGFGHLGGSNLEWDRAQVIELGRIGAGSFFAEEGIVIEMHQEQRSYTAVADERVVCYALDRIAFHKSIKGSILAMLQDMAHSKKKLREERVNTIIRNYISVQTGGQNQNQTVQTVLASTTSRRSRPSPPTSSTTSSAPLSIFHPPVRSKPLNCRHFGVIRIQGQVPRILDEDGGTAGVGDADAAKEMGYYDQDWEGEDEAEYSYRPSSGASSRSRRGSMHSLVEDDLSGAGAPIVSIGSGILSNLRRHNRHSSTASGGSVTLSRSETEALLLASAQARSLSHTRVVKDAVVQKRAASRSRSRSRSRTRGDSDGEDSRPNTAGTERSRPATGGRRATVESHAREAAPFYNSRHLQSTHHAPPPVEGPHPMIAASTVYALLGKKHSSTTPLAILTSSAIPLSALSALSPQPLPLRALLPSTQSLPGGTAASSSTLASTTEEDRAEKEIKELEERQRKEEEEQERKRAAEAAARASKDAARAHSRQQKDLRRVLHAELSRAMSIREGNEQDASTQASARPSISAAAGLAGQNAPTNAKIGSVEVHADDAAESSDSADDGSDDDDNDRPGAVSPDTLASLQSESAASRLEAAREEQRAREAWKTSPRRLSVLSRVMGIGTGQGSARVKDSETGTVLLDTTLAAKLAEEAVGNADMQELKRKHIMASLQRSTPSEPNTAREPFSAREPLSARPMDSSRGSSRSISPVRSQAVLNKLSRAGSIAGKEAEEEEKTGTGSLQESNSKSRLTTLLRSALADDPLLSGEQYYTSRSSGPFLFGSGQTLSVPATLSPFVLGTVNAAVQSTSEDGHTRVPSLTLPLAHDQSRKHRFIPLEHPDTVSLAASGGNASGGSKSARNSRDGLFPALTSAQASTSRTGRRHAQTMSLNAGLPLAHMHSGRTQYVQLGRAPAHAVMQAESSKRPYVSLSRAGMSKFGQHKVDLQAAKDEIANKASEGVQAPAADGSGKLVYVYTHANSGSISGSHSTHPNASSQHHSFPTHAPHHAPSGPSLLAASTVSAIERFLHTQLLLEQETTFASNPQAREGAAMRAGEEERIHVRKRQGKTTTQMNIRKLEAMAFRGVRRPDDSVVSDSLPLSPSSSSHVASSPGAASVTSSSSPLPSPASSSSFSHPHGSRRTHAAFSMAALLSLEKSEVPKFANAPPVAVTMTQHFRRQLAEPF